MATVTSFPDLQTAVLAAGDGDVIEIQGDITMLSAVTIAKNITIQSADPGAPSTLTMTGNDFHFYSHANTLTLQDIILEGDALIGTSGGGIMVDLLGGLVINEGTVIQNIKPTIGSAVYILADGTVTMNGGLITNNTAAGTIGGGVYVSGGSFTLIDGTISNNTASAGGGGIYVMAGGTLDMSGGAITDNNIEGIYLKDGIFTLSDGEISKNKVGGIYIETAGTLNMSGGLIDSNTTTGNGAGIAAELSNSLNITGGTISNNIADSQGGAIIATGSDPITISNVTLSGNKANGGNGGAIICSAPLTLTDCTVSGNTASSVGGGISSGSDVTLKGTTVISGNLAELSGGGIILTGKFTMEATSVISDNHAGTDGGGVYINGGSFSFNGGTFTKNTAVQYGGGIFVAGVMTMLTGTVGDNTGGYGGGIAVVPGGTLDMSSGFVTENKAAGSGGGIFASDGDILSISGGEISKNTASLTAGGVWIAGSAGTPEISNCIINENKAENGEGGGIISLAPLTITDCQITNNTASANGGGISSDSDVSLKGTTTLQGNNAQTGGGIILTGDLTMENTVSITNNTVSTNGGGVAVDGGIFTFDGGTISNNEATNGGGIIVFQGELAMSGGVVNENTAATNGGGIYILNNAIGKIEGGTINGNTVSGSGGGIFGDVLADISVSGAEITNNTAQVMGGGILYSVSTGLFTISNSKVSGNKANEGNGGGILCGNDILVDNCEISGNTAVAASGGGMSVGQAATVQGGSKITGNTAALDGGGMKVFSTDYANINIAADTVFDNNMAGNLYVPAENAAATYSTIKYASSSFAPPSIYEFLLNNYDINFPSANIVYNANGGTGLYTTYGIYPLPAAATILTPEEADIAHSGDYRFISWNTAADGNGTSYAPADTLTLNAAGATTLYAQWDAPSKITKTVKSTGAQQTGSIVEFDLKYTLAGNAADISEIVFTDSFTPKGALILYGATAQILNSGGAVVADFGEVSPIYNNADTEIIDFSIFSAPEFVEGNTVVLTVMYEITGTDQEIDNTMAVSITDNGVAKDLFSENPSDVIAPLYKITYLAGNSDSGVPPTDANLYPPGTLALVVQGTGTLAKAPAYTYTGWQKSDKPGTNYYYGTPAFPVTQSISMTAVWIDHTGTFEKDIVGASGSNTSQNGYKPGDTITYTLTYTIPSTFDGIGSFDVKDLVTPAGALGDMKAALKSITIGGAGVALSVPTYSVAADGLRWNFDVQDLAGQEGKELIMTYVAQVADSSARLMNTMRVTLRSHGGEIDVYENNSRTSDEILYKVTYGAGGGAGPVPVDEYVYNGGSVIVLDKPADLVNVGYSFAGWKNSVDSKSYGGGGVFTITQDTVLMAIWVDEKADYSKVLSNSSATGGYAVGDIVTFMLSYPTIADSSPINSTTITDTVSPAGALDLSVASVIVGSITLALDKYTFDPTSGAVTIPNSSLVNGATVTVTMQGTVVNSAAQITNTMSVSLDTTGGIVTQSPSTAGANEVDLYKVTYDQGDATGGSVPTDGNVYVVGDAMEVVGNTGNLTKDSNTFAGWKNAAAGKIYSSGDDVPISDNMVLTPVWIENKQDFTKTIIAATPKGYAVGEGLSFALEYALPTDISVIDAVIISDTSTPSGALALMLDGVKIDGTDVNASDYSFNASTGELRIAKTALTGHEGKGILVIMNGAVQNADAEIVNTFDVTIQTAGGDVPLIPQNAGDNEVRLYKVTYEEGDSTSGSAPTDDHIYAGGAEITVQGNTGGLGKDGNEFTGWENTADNSEYKPNDSLVITDSTTLAPAWKAEQYYKITYHANNGTNDTVVGESVLEGNNTTIKTAEICNFTNTNHTCAGWNTLAGGTGDTHAAGSVIPLNADLDLFAQWAAIAPLVDVSVIMTVVSTKQ